MRLVHPGDTFPRLTLNIPGAQAIQVPGWLAGEFGVVLFNRGAQGPYCTAQLRAFQRAGDSLAAAGIGVATLWVDDEQTTAEFTAKHGLTFPLGHSADARAVAALTGAFVHDNSLYLQSTGFVLDPQGTGRSVGLSGGPTTSCRSSNSLRLFSLDTMVEVCRWLSRVAASLSTAIW